MVDERGEEGRVRKTDRIINSTDDGVRRRGGARHQAAAPGGGGAFRRAQGEWTDAVYERRVR